MHVQKKLYVLYILHYTVISSPHLIDGHCKSADKLVQKHGDMSLRLCQ